ncbi:MAG: sensor domain-containing diguanylate cyclase [Smithellaceae bacterium]|nr:sensor domain-containing diguanylate cyclase [Smithellaceae bacterium]
MGEDRKKTKEQLLKEIKELRDDNTDRDRSAFMETGEMFRTVIEAVKVGITFSDEKGHFEAYNSEMEKLTGYSMEEANAADDFLALLYPDPEDHERALAGLNDLATSGASREVETEFRTKDGKQRQVIVSTTLIPHKGRRMFLSNYHDITERKQLEERLRLMSIIDDLTGLYNRRGFLALAEQQLGLAQRTKKEAVLFFIDLDHMKWINDTLGHQFGDVALIEIASILRVVFRKSDVISRIGGDEFAILATIQADSAAGVLARLNDLLTEHNRGERRYRLSLSVGVSHFDPAGTSTLQELIASADDLMYQEKKRKRRPHIQEEGRFYHSPQLSLLSA